MLSVLRHAHVTGVAMIGSVVVSYVWGHSTRNPRNMMTSSPSQGFGTTAWFLEYLAFPFPGALPREYGDAGAILSIAFYCRTLERQWGTARFLTVALIPLIISTLLLSSLAQVTSTSGLPLHHQSTPWVAALCALVYRYYTDIPSLATSNFNGIKFTDKTFIYVALFKLLSSPLYCGRPGLKWQHIGLQAAMAVLGVVVSAALRQYPRFTLLANYGPILKGFRSSTATAFGPDAGAGHTVPGLTAAQQAAAGGAGMGQVLVDDPLQAMQRMGIPPGARGHARPAAPPRAPGGGAMDRDEGMPGGGDYEGSGANSRDAFPSGEDLDLGIATIMSLGLPEMTVEKATTALRLANGNVDLAVGRLMEDL